LQFDNLDYTEQAWRLWKEIPRDKLIIDEKLGSGAFGVVMKGMLREKDGRIIPCAVKIHKCNYNMLNSLILVLVT
jgi:hypothetical protein